MGDPFMQKNIEQNNLLLKIRFICGIILVTLVTGCERTSQWGKDMSKMPEEYRIKWVETLPLKESLWAVPRLQRQGKLFFSGELQNNRAVQVLLTSAKEINDLTVMGSDRGPKNVTDVLDNGVLVDRKNPVGMGYWFSGKFDGRFLDMLVDSSNHVTGVILLTK